MLRNIGIVFFQGTRVFWDAIKVVVTAIVVAQGEIIGGAAEAILRVFGVSYRPSPKRQEPGFEQRLTKLTTELKRSGDQTVGLLNELQDEVQARFAAVILLEQQIEQLSHKETEAATRLAALQSLEPEAARELSRMVDSSLDKREKNSSKRDYIIFILGVLITIAATWIGAMITGD